LFANNQIYKSFLLNLRVQQVSGKNEYPAQIPWRWAPPEARDPMQLHRLKDGPGYKSTSGT